MKLAADIQNNEVPISSKLVGGLETTSISPYVEEGEQQML